jgi:glycosyltransferase involved in cell wall biosynthesis
MPGLVGLAILDCAAAGLPIVTTAYPYHSPEIAYLKQNHNGLIVEEWRDPIAYADAVVSVLRDDRLQARLALGAEEIGKLYSIERMVQCFSKGAITALYASKR